MCSIFGKFSIIETMVIFNKLVLQTRVTTSNLTRNYSGVPNIEMCRKRPALQEAAPITGHTKKLCIGKVSWSVCN